MIIIIIIMIVFSFIYLFCIIIIILIYLLLLLLLVVVVVVVVVLWSACGTSRRVRAARLPEQNFVCCLFVLFVISVFYGFFLLLSNFILHIILFVGFFYLFRVQ